MNEALTTEQKTLVDETEALLVASEESDAFLQERKLRDAAQAIVQRLQSLADETARNRLPVEQRWLEDMCQMYGVRTIGEIVGTKAQVVTDSAPARGDGRSRVFVNQTRPKTNRMIGKIGDILFPADDRNWGIAPTPQPDLDIVARRAMEEAQRATEEANRLASNGDATSPSGMSSEELLEMAQQLGPKGAEAAKVLAEAKQRSERMATVIDDQLVEALYAQKSRDALEWAGRLGIGILKGPVIMDGGRTSWQKADDGSFKLAPSGERARPTVECVSPWAFFPDDSAATAAEAEFFFERHLPNKAGLRKMARKLGFYTDALRTLISAGPGQQTGADFQYLRDMRLLTGESADIKNRYVVWEYHGSLEADEIASLLRAQGSPEALERAKAFEEEADPYADYRVIAFFCEGKLLKLTEYYPMDSGDFVYSVYSFEKGAASILGAIGLPRIMRDSQDVLNAAWRMMMDNAKLAVGPQVLIDKTRVTPADGDWTMYPGKEWLWDTANSVAGGPPPFDTFDIPMNQEEIAGIIALAKSFIDDETAMPSLLDGGSSEERAPGVASTVGGFAMMLNAAGVNVRRLVKNWDDDVTTGMIRRLYDWNMQHSDRDEIKGDMNVEARGTSVLLVREMQAQNLGAMAATWTVHPVLGMMIKAYDMARLTLQAMSINPSDVLIEREEFEKRVEAAAQQTQPDDPQWAARKEIAEIDRDGRLQVAAIQRDVAVLSLAEKSKQSINAIYADLEKARMANASKERLAAAEIAVEGQAARAAEAEGRVPTGSGGSISLGSKPAEDIAA